MKKIFYLNCIESGYSLLSDLLKEGIKIDHIISLTPEQAKNNKVSGYKNFLPLSQEYRVPIYYPEKYDLNGEQDVDFFNKHSPDLMLVFGWQRLVPAKILNVLSIGSLGAHGSSELLPKGRGRSPINWSLIENKNKFVLHLFYLDADADSGDIIDLMEFDLNKWDSCKTAYHKLQICLRKMLLKNLPLIFEGTENKTPQTSDGATYYPKRTPEDGEISWKSSTTEIYNLVRAVTKPYPGAFSPDKKIMIWECQPFDSKIPYKDSAEGEIVEVLSPTSFVVKTKDGSLLVTDYDYENPVNIGDFI